MSHASSVSARNLSLTEELEKLEQSITLTLQEIDHNFSRAHRIVTTSILPIVEQYADHSKAVWEGSKFWKQFFESSANVSLSGYEELAASERGEDVEQDTSIVSTAPPSQEHEHEHDNDARSNGDAAVGDESTVSQVVADDSLLSHRQSVTPRAAAAKASRPAPSFAPYSSPYETLRQQLVPSAAPQNEGPHTPSSSKLLDDDILNTPEDASSSPFDPPPPTTNTRAGTDNPLLHRVLDKNYRLQATPHLTARHQSPLRQQQQQQQQKSLHKRPAGLDSSPPDSPDMPAPQLHADIFSSPIRRKPFPNNTAGGAPRTPRPGVSVLRTPRSGRRGSIGRTGRTGAWDSSDDEDEGVEGDFSPPKTMQFAVPQSRLMQTPAREASKRIVEDLLLTAGANDTTNTDDGDGDGDGDGDTSPMVIRGGLHGLGPDDTF